MEQVQAKADEASASLREASAQASAAAAAAAEVASEQTAALTQSARAQADSMITEVQDYLRENDLDSAQGVLDKLEALRDQVSAEVRTEIDALQKRLSEDEAQNQPAGWRRPPPDGAPEGRHRSGALQPGVAPAAFVRAARRWHPVRVRRVRSLTRTAETMAQVLLSLMAWLEIIYLIDIASGPGSGES
jgi:hypothetical protein